MEERQMDTAAPTAPAKPEPLDTLSLEYPVYKDKIMTARSRGLDDEMIRSRLQMREQAASVYISRDDLDRKIGRTPETKSTLLTYDRQSRVYGYYTALEGKKTSQEIEARMDLAESLRLSESSLINDDKLYADLMKTPVAQKAQTVQQQGYVPPEIQMNEAMQDPNYAANIEQNIRAGNVQESVLAEPLKAAGRAAQKVLDPVMENVVVPSFGAAIGGTTRMAGALGYTADWLNNPLNAVHFDSEALKGARDFLYNIAQAGEDFGGGVSGSVIGEGGPNMVQKVSMAMGSSLPSMALGFGIAPQNFIGNLAAQGWRATSDAFGEAASVQRQVLEAGGSEEEARSAANKTAVANLAWNVIAEKFGPFGEVGQNTPGMRGRLLRGLVQGSGEMAQESFQDMFSNAVAARTEDGKPITWIQALKALGVEAKDLPKYLMESGLPAFLSSALIGAATPGRTMPRGQAVDNLTKQGEAMEGRAVDMTAAERAQAAQQMREQGLNAQENAPIVSAPETTAEIQEETAIETPATEQPVAGQAVDGLEVEEETASPADEATFLTATPEGETVAETETPGAESEPVVFLPREALEAYNQAYPGRLGELGIDLETDADLDTGEVMIDRALYDTIVQNDSDFDAATKDDVRMGARAATNREAMGTVANALLKQKHLLRADTPQAEEARGIARRSEEQARAAGVSRVEARAVGQFWGTYALILGGRTGLAPSQVVDVEIRKAPEERSPSGVRREWNPATGQYEVEWYSQPLNPDVDPNAWVDIVDIDPGQYAEAQMSTPKDLLNHVKSFIGKEAMLSADSKALLKMSSNSKAKHFVRSSKDIDTFAEMHARNAAIRSMDDVVKNSVLIESHPNRDSQKVDLENVHRFYVPLRIGDELHTLRVVAHEMKDKSGLTPIEAELYDVMVENKKSSTPATDSLSGATLSSASPGPHSSGTSKITIREMLQGVKDAGGENYVEGFNQSPAPLPQTPEGLQQIAERIKNTPSSQWTQEDYAQVEAFLDQFDPSDMATWGLSPEEWAKLQHLEYFDEYDYETWPDATKKERAAHLNAVLRNTDEDPAPGTPEAAILDRMAELEALSDEESSPATDAEYEKLEQQWEKIQTNAQKEIDALEREMERVEEKRATAREEIGDLLSDRLQAQIDSYPNYILNDFRHPANKDIASILNMLREAEALPAEQWSPELRERMADFIASERESEYWGRNPYDRAQFMAASALDFAIPSTWANYEETADQGRRAMDLEERIAATLDPQEKKALRSELAALKKEVKPLLKEAEAWREDVIVIDEARINAILEKAKSLGLRAETYNQSVYHGTPHRFDRFDLSKIGTGEGNQSYGWGLYFAGDRGISEWYRKTLSQSHLPVEQFWQNSYHKDEHKVWLTPQGNPVSSEVSEALDYLHDNTLYGVRNVAELRHKLEQLPYHLTHKGWSEQESATLRNVAQEMLQTINKLQTQGQLFKVDIPESNTLLDHDKALSEQPTKVQEALREKIQEAKLLMSDQLMEAANDLKQFQKELKDAGLDGVSDDYRYRNHFSSMTMDILRMIKGFPTDVTADLRTEIQALSYRVDDRKVTGKSAIQKLSKLLAAWGTKPELHIPVGTRADFYNTLARELGSDKAASEYLHSLGIPGLRYLDANSRRGEKETHNYVIWDENAVNILETYYQQMQQQAEQDANRARIRFTPEGKAIIDIFQARDASSLFHELGHKILYDFTQFADREGVSEQYRKDAKAAFEYLGITPEEFLIDADKRVEAHEKFAKSFEAYLAEGRAPSKEMRGVFKRLKTWLVDVYRNVSQALGVELNDEIRGVFDRILATDEQIDAEYEAQTQVGALAAEHAAIREEIKRLERRAREAGAEGLGFVERDVLRKLREKEKAEAYQKQEITRLAKDVNRMADSESIKWERKKEIEKKLADYDLKRRQQKTLDRRAELEAYLAENPDAVDSFNPDDMKYLGTQTLNTMSIEDLKALHEEIRDLHAQGQREFVEWESARRQKVDEKFSELARSLMKKKVEQPSVQMSAADTKKQYEGIRGKLEKSKDWGYAATLGGQRFFDWLDGGGAKYKGAFVRYFMDEFNAARDTELRHVFERRDWMQAELRKLGLDMQDFSKIRAKNVHGKDFTVDQIMEIYIGMRNNKKAAAILYGVFRDVADPRGTVADLIGRLTPEEKRAAELVPIDHNMNVDRIEGAFIQAFNKGMDREENYTSIHRIEHGSPQGLIDAESAESLAQGMADAGFMRRIEDGFTKARVEIKDAGQTGIKLGLFSNWHDDVSRHEHSAAFAGLARETAGALMQKNPADNRTSLGKMIKERFGDEAWKTLVDYFNIAVTDDVRMAHNVLDGASSYLAKNMSIAYLCGNLGTVMKQMTSIPRFLITAGPHRILSSIGQFMISPKAFLDTVYELDPQMQDRQGSALLRAIRQNPDWGKNIYQKAIDIGMEPISVFDRWVAAIGWKATYDANLKRGLSREAAIREAQRAVALTQQTAHAKDAPAIWRQSGLTRLAMVFTSDAAQTFGMTTYDFAQQMRTGQLDKAMGTMLGLTLSAMLMKAATDGIPWNDDDDDEEQSVGGWVMEAFTEQAVESIPLVGKELMMLYDRLSGKYMGSQYSAIVAPIEKLARAAQIMTKEDEDERDAWKASFLALEGLSLLGIAPLPATGIKRVLQSSKLWLQEGEPMDAALNMVGRRPPRRE